MTHPAFVQQGPPAFAYACQGSHERGFSFFSRYKAFKPQPATFTTLNRAPGMSPTACPRRPKPAISTSSFSSMKLRQPSRGTKAAIFLPFLMSCTRTHLRMAELGCLASMPIFSSTMPLACDAPPKGLAYCEMLCDLAYSLFAHFWSRRWFLSLRPARRPFGLPLPMVRAALSAESLGCRLK